MLNQEQLPVGIVLTLIEAIKDIPTSLFQTRKPILKELRICRPLFAKESESKQAEEKKLILKES